MAVAAHGWAWRAYGWSRRAYPQVFLFLFDLLKQVSNHLEKDLIYRDLSTKAVEFSAVHGRNYKATITAEFHSMVIETVQLLC